MIAGVLKRYKNQIGDSIFSLAGLVIMNAVAQIVVFPLCARRFGEVGYGNLQYLMAYINVLTVSVGSAANYARMVAPAEERVKNSGDYNVFLLLVSLVGVPFTYLVRLFGGAPMDNATYICYCLLFVAMAFRYYADVSYKITLQYRRFFLYYLFIGIGYAIGAVLVWKTGIWPLGLLVGEAMGVLYAYGGSAVLRRRAFRLSPAWRKAFRVILTFFLAEAVANLILNVDRILLKLLLGASAVTVYYLATLVGKTISVLTGPLNGVLIGYLARYEGKLTRRTMRLLTLGSLAAILVFTLVCWGGGYVAVFLLYPAEFDAVKDFLLVGSLAQVVYFITGILMVVLIRFAKKSYQIFINAIFGISFFGLGIPATCLFGLWGFSLAMVVACLLRFAAAIGLGFRWVRKKENDPDGMITA
ncbi:MAG: oligosaccharide flippase family protein [Clostridia bacterium]|nr:oligosaccharide flippase family protein [Clostridia bacterium]MBQ3056997.1 oligosaccharide flippase family protein [Clostridia bacterium]